MVPTSEPAATPIATSVQVITWASNRVATTAMSMPTAEIRLPLRAVAGELSIFRPRMNSTAATTYARLISRTMFMASTSSFFLNIASMRSVTT